MVLANHVSRMKPRESLHEHPQDIFDLYCCFFGLFLVIFNGFWDSKEDNVAFFLHFFSAFYWRVIGVLWVIKDH